MTREQQVSVSLVFVTPNAAAQLVEIAEAEAVGTVDDDRVGIGNIEAAFDNGCGKQDIRFAIDKLSHDLLEIIAIHLPVTDENACLRDERLKLLGHRLNGHDPVVQKENLPPTIDFALNGTTDDPFVVLSHNRFDW